MTSSLPDEPMMARCVSRSASTASFRFPESTALPIARALDERLVGNDLASALRTALDDPTPDYSARALDALVPFRREAVDRMVAKRLLPRLLA